MRGLACAAASAVGGIVALAACAAPSDQDAQPWDEPADYVYEATITVFGTTAGTWRITVDDRAVAAAEPLDELAEYSAHDYQPALEDFPTLTGLVELYNLGVADGYRVADLEQADDGTPRRLELDPDENAIDDEYAIDVLGVDVG
ncbi:DUF6174 domain-containing protein [Demequina iriomotensis]|uniref:DUF6174 domain-containing protein n=1 Tax=Demequina iriomotensis TaxID=1536641 RepID=UPI000784A85E|nr:DUF6174 domain-containing protein [Demequina iriomotensis]